MSIEIEKYKESYIKEIVSLFFETVNTVNAQHYLQETNT